MRARGAPPFLPLVVVAALTACAAPGPSPSPVPSRFPAPSRSSIPSGSPAASGSAAVSPPSAPAASVPPRADCVAATELATVRPNEEAGPICLRVGAKLEITSAPAPGQPWLPLTSSAPSVLRCTSSTGENGTVSGRCDALAPGRALVSTATKFQADGAQDRWTLTVDITA